MDFPEPDVKRPIPASARETAGRDGKIGSLERTGSTMFCRVVLNPKAPGIFPPHGNGVARSVNRSYCRLGSWSSISGNGGMSRPSNPAGPNSEKGRHGTERDRVLGIVVSLNGGRPKKPSPDRLSAAVADDMTRVNRMIVDRMASQAVLIPQLAGHIVAAGGKRLRPMLTLASAEICGYEGDRHVPLATVIEFLHTATLLHVDVVDESGLRRGQASANAVWGNKSSVLVGDFLFSRAFEIMVEDGSWRF